MDSSSSSRSRSVIIPTLPDASSGAAPTNQSRFSTSTRMSSSKFSGLNDSGVGSTCTTVAFAEKERQLGRLRFPSSPGGCTVVATGGIEDCSKNLSSQNPFSSTIKSGKNKGYFDPHQNSKFQICIAKVF